jgi:hypothetical protein
LNDLLQILVLTKYNGNIELLLSCKRNEIERQPNINPFFLWRRDYFFVAVSPDDRLFAIPDRPGRYVNAYAPQR